MRILGICFAGASTEQRTPMAEFVGDVLGLPRRHVAGVEADLFGLPDGSSFAVASPGGMGESARSLGFLVADLDEAVAELAAAGVATDAPASNETERYVHFTAPDGHLYELVERRPARTSTDELEAFETATRALVGLALRSVQDLEVTLSQFRLLLALDELGPASSTQCAQALGVVGSSVTRLADRLHASGHLVRGADPDNRSVVTLELTHAGRRVVREVRARRHKELREVLDRLAPTERASCAAALEKLHQLSDDDSTGDPQDRLPL